MSGSRIECSSITSLLSPRNALRRIIDFSKKLIMKSSSQSRNIVPSQNVKAFGCPKIRSRKRAVLCGVTYQNSKYRLEGTINDVKSMRDLLIQRFGYSEDCILVLTEEEKEQDLTPTKKYIQASLKWLVKGSEVGDLLVFYFSGHGVRQPIFNNDVLDGFDESICPVDFMQEGMILDKDINSTIVQPLKKGVTLHAIVDACHSGTILDLEYIYNKKTEKWEDNSRPSKAQKSTSGGMAICFSACGDDQMAADTSAFSTGELMTGAMTYTLIQTVQRCRSLTYGSLLEIMHETLQQVNSGTCLKSRLLHRLFHHRIIQHPLLSSSEVFDVDENEFIL